jgi:hypothetical protein
MKALPAVGFVILTFLAANDIRPDKFEAEVQQRTRDFDWRIDGNWGRWHTWKRQGPSTAHMSMAFDGLRVSPHNSVNGIGGIQSIRGLDVAQNIVFEMKGDHLGEIGFMVGLTSSTTNPWLIPPVGAWFEVVRGGRSPGEHSVHVGVRSPAGDEFEVFDQEFASILADTHYEYEITIRDGYVDFRIEDIEMSVPSKLHGYLLEYPMHAMFSANTNGVQAGYLGFRYIHWKSE